MPDELVDLGCSGAVVRRSADGRTHTKTVRLPHHRVELRDERDRLLWLAGTSVPSAVVVDWVEDDAVATLTTATVPGMPASSLTGLASAAAVETLAAFLSELHALPVADCPFDRRLDVVLPAAVSRVTAGLVDESDFDAERFGQSAGRVLADLQDRLPRARALEDADLAVCHGDACLPNLMMTPDGTALTGLVDVGRLGVADRHQDLALLTRSMAAVGLNPAFGPPAAVRFAELYPSGLDPCRLSFYRLLDELW